MEESTGLRWEWVWGLGVGVGLWGALVVQSFKQVSIKF